MKRAILLASVVALGLPVAVAVSPAVGAAQRVDRATATGFTGDASRLRGHGELAVIGNDQQLYLIGGGARGVHKVALDGRPSVPRWSHDGRWLAVTTHAIPPAGANLDEPTTVWLISRAGKIVRRLTPTGQDVYHAAVAWSPRSNTVAIEYTAGVGTAPTQRVDLVDTTGKATSLASAQTISGFAWAPDGRRIVVGINHFENSPGKWNSRLVTFNSAGAHRHTVATDLGDVFDVAGWWPDGSGILAWRDVQGSASLLADGVPLLDVSVKTGHRRQLAKTMLEYSGWLATSPLTNKVAFIAGGDRIPTNGHKHLVVCTKTKCHRVPQPDRKVTFDPAWSIDGQLAAVRDHAIDPKGDYSMTFTKQVESSGGLDLLRRGVLRPVAGGEQGTAPVWDKLGSILFVRGGSLYLLRPGAQHAHRVAGPLDSSDAFYGFVSWWDSFAWSAAVRDDVPLGTTQVI